VTIKELHHIMPEVSKTTIHEAKKKKLGYRKLCAQWVPKMLTDEHKTLLEKFNWDILNHPPYSLDLAPNNFPLFLHLKEHLTGKKFNDDDDEV
jgi:hypothetical protein